MDSTDTSMYAIGCKRIKMEDCETKATDHEIIEGNLDANSYVITEIKQEDQCNQDMNTTTSTTLLNLIEQEHIIPDECGTSIESQSKEDLIEVFKIEIDEFDEHQLNEVEDPGPSRDQLSIHERLQKIEENQNKIGINQKEILKSLEQMNKQLLENREETLDMNTKILATLKQITKKNQVTVLDFPVQNVTSLKTLNERIQQNPDEYIVKLKAILNPNGLIMNFHRIFSAEIIMQCNYDGMKDKIAFKDYKAINNAIFESLKKDGYSEIIYKKEICLAFHKFKAKHYKHRYLEKKKKQT